MVEKNRNLRTSVLTVNNTGVSGGSYYITSDRSDNSLVIGQGNTLNQNVALSITKVLDVKVENNLKVNDEIIASKMQQYISVTLTSDTDPDDDEYNPFIYGKCGGCTYNYNASNGITFNETTGRFTIINSGVYEITSVMYMNGTTGVLTSFKLRKNDTEDIWSAETTVHSSVDPVERTINGFFTLSASDFIEVKVDGTALSVRDGSSMNIKRIA